MGFGLRPGKSHVLRYMQSAFMILININDYIVLTFNNKHLLFRIFIDLNFWHNSMEYFILCFYWIFLVFINNLLMIGIVYLTIFFKLKLLFFCVFVSTVAALLNNISCKFKLQLFVI